MIQITRAKIDESAVLNSVKSDLAGACVLFVGTTRRLTDDRETASLNYEIYEKMAISEIEQLLQQCRQKWAIENAAVVHRIGEVPVGESSVAVAISSAHREAAFESARWIMDAVKRTVPIWKQEIADDGSREWIHNSPNLQTNNKR